MECNKMMGDCSMKLTVLVDNNTYIDQYYLGEPAACFIWKQVKRRSCLMRDIQMSF